MYEIIATQMKSFKAFEIIFGACLLVLPQTILKSFKLPIELALVLQQSYQILFLINLKSLVYKHSKYGISNNNDNYLNKKESGIVGLFKHKYVK